MKPRKSNAIKRLGAMLKTSVDSGSSTAIAVAKKSGVPRSYLYRLMDGKVPGMTVLTLEAICAAIGVQPAELFGGRGPAPKAEIQAWERVGRYLQGK